MPHNKGPHDNKGPHKSQHKAFNRVIVPASTSQTTETVRPVILWFRQDLRLSDHAALEAAARAGPVLPVFILDDVTPGPWAIGSASRWWLHHSLKSLGDKIPLILRAGPADQILRQLLQETGARGIYFTRDYAPWSPPLEQKIKIMCQEMGADCHRYGGYLLHEPEAIKNGQNLPYRVFTPFAKACWAQGEPSLPRKSQTNPQYWPAKIASDQLVEWQLCPKNPNWAQSFAENYQPGEMAAQQRLYEFIETDLTHYASQRNRPDLESTSRLSPHLHWGEISPAQCWVTVKTAMSAAGGRLDATGHKFLSEILWREFSSHLLFHFPTLTHSPFRPEFETLWPAADPARLTKWQKGKTGYPIIDAGMQELWVTGIMHNRVRMIVGSFLTKHLLQPWQEGARLFWDQLLDADIASNSASWQWVAGCGADAAPYVRIFNPLLQGEKFDPQGHYVKKWLPALKAFPSEFIHQPWKAENLLYKTDYPAPMIPLDVGRKQALVAWEKLKDNQPKKLNTETNDNKL